MLIIYVLTCLMFCVYSEILNTGSEKKCVLKSNKCPDTEYRSIDGSCNNLERPYIGKSFTPYPRLAPNFYSDGVHKLPVSVSGKPLPSAREISNTLLPPGDDHSSQFTLAHMQLGQLVAHDVGSALGGKSHPECCSNFKLGSNPNSTGCGYISIPPNDPVYNTIGFECLPLERTVATQRNRCKRTPYEQINAVTSYLDLSIIYGSTSDQAKNLRENNGGRLKICKINNQDWPPTNSSTGQKCPGIKSTNDVFFMNGDDRNNQNPNLLAFHIMFHREHNRLANILQKKNPHWCDEKLYQEARKINIGQYQHIVYYELLPNFLGKERMICEGLLFPHAHKMCIDDYDKKIETVTYNEFGAAAWRYFHRRIVSSLKLYSKNRECLGTIDITDWMNRGDAMINNETLNMDSLVRGMTIQEDHVISLFVDQGIKDKIFKDQSGYGEDLIAKDIQRGRDHGIVNYVEARRVLGLPVPKSWKDLEKYIAKKVVPKLKTLYESIEDIELVVGGSFEPHVEDADSGETFLKIMIKQFQKMRRGDRLFYENCENNLTFEQLNSIRKVTLARIICDNSDVVDIQPKATKVISNTNEVRLCEEIPKLDL